MSDINDSETYSLITNVHKPPKTFDFPETNQPLGLCGLNKIFQWFCHSWWENGAYWLRCMLFAHKYRRSSSLENLCKIPY